MAEDRTAFYERKAQEREAAAAPVGPTPGFRAPAAAGGLDTVNAGWPGPVKAAAEREAGLNAGASSLGSPESYGGGFRAPQPQLRESQLSTGAQRFIPIDREFDQPASSWKSGGQMAGSVQAPVPGRDLSEKDPNTGYDPSKPSFSNPVHVIRRMAQTWTGPSGEEYKTPQQANQAFIRARQGTAPAGSIPGYDPPGGPGFRAVGEQQRLTQAAENKRPEAVMKAKVDEYNWQQAQKAKVGTDFESRALKRWGTYKDGKPARPTEEHILRDLDEAKEYAMEQGNPQAGHNYMEWSKWLREMYPDIYATTMKTNPLAWRDVVISHGPKLPAPTTGFRAPTAPAFSEPDRVTSGLSPFGVGP